MPQAENTAAGGLDTIRFQGADEIKTAVLVVESLPIGTTLFVGSEAVAHAAEDGRATVSLKPGAYEIRATTPSGATATEVVSVTTQDTGAFKTITLPLTQAPVTGAALAASRPEQSRRGKQMAAAAVVILLLALAAAAYFVLRGPSRAHTDPAQNTASSGPAPAPSPDSSSVKQPDAQTDNQQASEDKQQTSEDRKKAVDARRQAEQEAAATEAHKKAAEKDKADKRDTSSQKPAPPVAVQQPPVAAPPPAADTAPQPAGREGCVLVTVLDADGMPATRIKVGLIDVSEGGGPSARFGGFTGPKGHWQHCGLTPGHSVRVAVMGPLGGLLNSDTAIVAGPRTFITLHLQRKMDDAPQGMPDRKRPFRRRP